MWELILIAVAKVVSFVLDKVKADAELKKKWFEFVKDAGDDLSSVRLYEYGRESMKFFDETPFEETK